MDIKDTIYYLDIVPIFAFKELKCPSTVKVMRFKGQFNFFKSIPCTLTLPKPQCLVCRHTLASMIKGQSFNVLVHLKVAM